MAITADVKNQLFRRSSGAASGEGTLIRLPRESVSAAGAAPASPCAVGGSSSGRAWTPDEHDRFLEGLEMFPSGPWKEIAAHVGTRTTRQTMTHAQKYREKIARRKRGLRAPSSSARARALGGRRRRPRTSATSLPSAARDASPRGVDDAPASPATSSASDYSAADAGALCEDPLDFTGCFAATPMAFASLAGAPPMAVGLGVCGGGAAVATHLFDCGALLPDVEPLPLSEEEIDELLDVAAALPAAAYPEPTFLV